MVDFIRPNLLGSLKDFTNRFINPITNGQYSDSTPLDVALMKKRSHVLHRMLEGFVQVIFVVIFLLRIKILNYMFIKFRNVFILFFSCNEHLNAFIFHIFFIIVIK